MFAVLHEDISCVRTISAKEFECLRATLYDGGAVLSYCDKPTLFISLRFDKFDDSTITADMAPRLGTWVKDFVFCKEGYSLVNHTDSLNWSEEGFILADRKNGKHFHFHGDHVLIKAEPGDDDIIKNAILSHVEPFVSKNTGYRLREVKDLQILLFLSGDIFDGSEPSVGYKT